MLVNVPDICHQETLSHIHVSINTENEFRKLSKKVIQILMSFHLKTKHIVPHSAVIFEAAMSTFLVRIALSQVLKMTSACQQKTKKIVVVSKLENSANVETQESVLIGRWKEMLM